jgi:hypothetical protein
MFGQWISRLDHVVAGLRSWPMAPLNDDRPDEATMRAQYHLGRGRRAREAGHPERGVREARAAVRLNPQNPWAHALLGQCLLRARTANLHDARQALERACRLDPTNGYFVRLSLEVLNAQHDARGRAELLSRAWWAGAPVERWLPGGPQPETRTTLAPADRREPAAVSAPTTHPNPVPAPVTAGAGRRPVPA